MSDASSRIEFTQEADGLNTSEVQFHRSQLYYSNRVGDLLNSKNEDDIQQIERLAREVYTRIPSTIMEVTNLAGPLYHGTTIREDKKDGVLDFDMGLVNNPQPDIADLLLGLKFSNVVEPDYGKPKKILLRVPQFSGKQFMNLEDSVGRVDWIFIEPEVMAQVLDKVVKLGKKDNFKEYGDLCKKLGIDPERYILNRDFVLAEANDSEKRFTPYTNNFPTQKEVATFIKRSITH